MKVGSTTLSLRRLQPVLSVLAVVCVTREPHTQSKRDDGSTVSKRTLGEAYFFFPKPWQSLEIRVESSGGEINQALLTVAKHIRDLMLS